MANIIAGNRLALTPGVRLGPYEILSALGAGGMGEVYRARDTRLNRDVAIKVLPESFGNDPDRLARFQREAQVLASLNHPNIGSIHGLEEANGITALVMELVEGEDLSQRIARGAMAIEEALPIAKQIAEALEAAHEQGIIHRDLKPANVKVRADGTVKVLDFGLAKAMEPASGSSASMSLSPTITTPAMTQMGMILGTASYMAPEQARGKAVDKRADIWAFGCVLYEMLTGKRAFDGEDVIDVLGAVVRLDPDWTAIPEATPPVIRRLVRRCLEKDRKRRMADISTAVFLIEELRELPVDSQRPLVASRRSGCARCSRSSPRVSLPRLLARSRGRSSPRGVFGNTSAQYSVSGSGSLVFVLGPVSTSGALREIVWMNRKGGVEQVPLPPKVYSSLRVSPDGRQLAFGTDDGKEAIVSVYDLSRTSAPRRLTFEGGNRFPIWSGDGQRVVFQSDREGDPGLYWQRADGSGTAERLTTPDKGTAHIPESWSATDQGFSFSVVAGPNVSLWTFSMSQKKAVPFGDLRSAAPLNSEFSPDGRWLAYTLRTGNRANVFVEPYPATGAKYQITTGNGHHPVWLSDGKGLSYRVSTNQQEVVSVNTKPSFSIGKPTPMIEGGLPTVVSLGSRSYDITPDGVAFLTVTAASGFQLGSVETREIQIVLNWHEELKRLVPTK